MSDPTFLSHEGITYDIEVKNNSGNTVIFQRRQAVVVFNGNVVEKLGLISEGDDGFDGNHRMDILMSMG